MSRFPRSQGPEDPIIISRYLPDGSYELGEVIGELIITGLSWSQPGLGLRPWLIS